MTDYAPFPLIELGGSLRERSTHGKAAADRPRRGIRMYSESLLKERRRLARELERRAGMVPAIDKFDPTYVEEMRGIAEDRVSPSPPWC
jgi:isopenicillin-N N-acyltransferase-like protein